MYIRVPILRYNSFIRFSLDIHCTKFYILSLNRIFPVSPTPGVLISSVHHFFKWQLSSLYLLGRGFHSSLADFFSPFFFFFLFFPKNFASLPEVPTKNLGIREGPDRENYRSSKWHFIKYAWERKLLKRDRAIYSISLSFGNDPFYRSMKIGFRSIFLKECGFKFAVWLDWVFKRRINCRKGMGAFTWMHFEESKYANFKNSWLIWIMVKSHYRIDPKCWSMRSKGTFKAANYILWNGKSEGEGSKSPFYWMMVLL